MFGSIVKGAGSALAGAGLGTALGAGSSIGSSIAGPLIGAGSSILGGVLSDRASAKQAEKDRELQKEFAKQGIQWRVEDARKAGIHPLAALGSSGAQYQNVSPVTGATGQGLSFAGQEMGQAIGRSLGKTDAIPPTGVTVFPSGSEWPHYSDPKSGKAVPYTAEQAQNYFKLKEQNATLQNLQANTNLANAEASAIKAGPPKNNMFEVFHHPKLGPIPFPNQQLGESAEALANPYIGGSWLMEIQRVNPQLYSQIISDAARGKTAALTELVGHVPGLVREVLKEVKKQMDEWNWSPF